MMVLYSSIVTRREKNTYTFKGDKITMTCRGKSETFDFTGMPDGVAEVKSEVFDFEPVLSVKRVDGVLWVELLKFIGFDAPHEDKFPEWFEVKSDGKD